jgi:hypothetical protein
MDSFKRVIHTYETPVSLAALHLVDFLEIVSLPITSRLLATADIIPSFERILGLPS